MRLNEVEREYQKQLQADVEIPEVVIDRVQAVYRKIEQHEVKQEAANKENIKKKAAEQKVIRQEAAEQEILKKKIATRKQVKKGAGYWMKVGGKLAGGMAAVLAVGFVICVANPVMAKNLPLVGGIFAILQDKVSFFGDFATRATPLVEPQTIEKDTGGENNIAASNQTTGQTAGQTSDQALEQTTGQTADQTLDQTSDQAADQTAENTAGQTSENGESAASAYTVKKNGLEVSFSEVYANDQAVYLTMTAKSDTAFPDTMLGYDEIGSYPLIDLIDANASFSFRSDYSDGTVPQEGIFLDENTYSCIVRVDLAQALEDTTEYNTKYEQMCQDVLDEMGVTMEDLNDETEEGYALLTEFNDKVLAQAGALASYKKTLSLQDSFTLHLDFGKFVGYKAEPQEWDCGYTEEEMAAMSQEEMDELLNQRPKEYNETPNQYYNWWIDGPWSFDIPVTVDRSQTYTVEINETNEAGIGLKSVVKTPYELTVNELYAEGSDSDCFMVALDANGNKLPYNNSNASCNNFAIQDRDISTVDIYILDYIQYMDELKGEARYNNNENKPQAEKWSTLLETNAKYHKTIHFS